MTPKPSAPSIHSFYYLIKQHVSKLNFKTSTKTQYCESAWIVRSIFTFNLQTVNAFFKKKNLNSAIKQPLTIQTDPRTRKKSINVRSVVEISL
jgi:hypothetical protein